MCWGWGGGKIWARGWGGVQRMYMIHTTLFLCSMVVLLLKKGGPVTTADVDGNVCI